MLRRARGPIAALVLALLLGSACGAGGFFGKRYEYEEDVTIALDGSASLTINTSIPALIALRGVTLDTSSDRVDRERIRALYESPVTEVTRVSRPWRRNGRRYVQIRVKTDDIRKLSEVAPFAWSNYQLTESGGAHTFTQIVGPAAMKPGSLTNVGWNGSELVAFRLHLPSRILEHNSRDPDTDETNSVQRGNIVAWEQHLADRLEGKPVQIVVRMSSESILYRTLWLFASAFGAALLLLAGFVWWTLKRGAREREVSTS
jgi:hypothetical protein